jgi:hypothetical protein
VNGLTGYSDVSDRGNHHHAKPTSTGSQGPTARILHHRLQWHRRSRLHRRRIDFRVRLACRSWPGASWRLLLTSFTNPAPRSSATTSLNGASPASSSPPPPWWVMPLLARAKRKVAAGIGSGAHASRFLADRFLPVPISNSLRRFALECPCPLVVGRSAGGLVMVPIIAKEGVVGKERHAKPWYAAPTNRSSKSATLFIKGRRGRVGSGPLHPCW